MTRRSSRQSLLVFVSLIGLMALPAARGQQQAPNQPGTTWNERQLRDAVDLARVGRKLTPKTWPNGARVAVCLSFDTDTEAPLLRRHHVPDRALRLRLWRRERHASHPEDAGPLPDSGDVLRHGRRRDAAPGHALGDCEE